MFLKVFFKYLYINNFLNINKFDLNHFDMYCDGLKFFKIKFNESLFLNSYKNYDIISFLDEFDDFMEDSITYLNEIFNENQFDFF